MNYIRNISNNYGSITVAAALVLCAVIVLNITLYDYVTFKTYESRVEAQMRLACNSVLSSFDSLLAEKYGLYGFNSGSGSTPKDLFVKYYKAKDCDVNLTENFTEPEVLKNQICNMMKIKTPVNITEMVLEAMDVISEAEKNGEGFMSCGNAAEYLTELQYLQNELKLKVEGYYPGDPICVNGYSQAALSDLLKTVIELGSNVTKEQLEEFLEQAIFLQEQYLEFNNQAAKLCKELENGAELIDGMLSPTESTSKNVLQNAADIKRCANKLSSSGAAKDIAENISIFTERIQFLKQIQNSIELSDLKELKAVFEKGKINTDIKINIIYAENSSGLYTDERNVLQSEIKNKLNPVILSEDTYEIPSVEYAALPSIRTHTSKNVSFNMFNYNTENSLDSFSNFESFFMCWSDVSFKNILKDTAQSMLVDSYITEYMTNRLSAPSDNSLNNKIEYILGGSATCEDNNNSAEQKIIAIRFITNFINIMSDSERMAVAEEMAQAIAAALSMGAGVTLYKYIIISAWSLIDSCVDLEKLLSGESVPLISFGNASDEVYINEIQDYSFYLRILLLLTPMETKLMRICDVIEMDMCDLTGMTYRLSGVYNKITARAITELNFVSPFIIGKKGNKYYGEAYCEVQY